MNRINRAGLTVSVIALGALTIHAAEQDKAAPQASKAAASQKTAAPAGLVAVKDPVTGQLRQATAEEIGALSSGGGNAAARSAEPVVVQRADGMMSVLLGPDQMSYSVVIKTADGKLVESCVTGEDAAKKTLTLAPLAPAKGKEKLDDK